MANNFAKSFITKWTNRGNEKQETQQYWNDIVFGLLGAPKETHIEYEKPVKINGQTKYIDAYLPETRVLIEQKSLKVDLMKAELQSDGTKLTPYEQGRRYGGYLPFDEQPRWIIDCNFEQIRVHDMKKPGEAPEIIYLKDLAKDYTRLNFMIRSNDEHIQKELELSLKAGDLVGKIHDRFLEQYHDPMAKKTQNSLNILCTRLVFCLYAEDAGLLGAKDAFTEYISKYDPGDIRQALINLFKVLDTPEDERADLYLSDELEAFPYCNGGLFANENIVIPKITQEIKDTLIDAVSFNWSEISPTIFGAVFESTLNNETRRAGGMHYTSIENIHKVIDPLFLDDLKQELSEIKDVKVQKSKESKLRAYQDKLASFKFLDPACGSGNFLTETYICLRRLENEVLKELNNGQIIMGFDGITNPIKVSIDQFYGFEINDFAVTVAKTALWIAESQMMQETESIVAMHLHFLPLKTNATITECNALRIDWWRYIDRRSLTYIMGNPPFVGYSLQSKDQKEDILAIFIDEKGKPYKTAGKIDYVAGWYWKAAEFMQGTKIKAALVSTNSITQGEQVASIWKPLYKRFRVHIDFAYKTFIWDSEANIKAHVHCVIIGFSVCSDDRDNPKRLFSEGSVQLANNINPYLVDAGDIFIEGRTHPLCQVPTLQNGGKPTEGGYLILTEEERNELLASDPAAIAFIRPYMMGKDFIQRKPRYCLWMVNANPSIVKLCPNVLKRVAQVREYRAKSPKPATQKKAETPMLFDEVRECTSDYVAIPKVSSEKRRYIPMEYLSADIIPGDKLFMIQESTLYHFGVLTSNVHMAWMRAVAGRLKSDYSYSNTIVYNNFPWPSPTNAQKSRIEQTAQGILDARAKYPNSSLADLYDELAMPIDLRKAHQANDRAVMEAYGFSLKMTEQECVAELMKMYQTLTEQ